MKTIRSFSKSTKLLQKTKKQKKTRRTKTKKTRQTKTKKTRQTKTRGGFHTIEPDVEEVDIHADDDITPEMQNIMDEMINFPFMQKEDIFTINQHLNNLRYRYMEDHPNEILAGPYQAFIQETTNTLLHTLSLNINNTTSYIHNMIQHNDIDTANIIHDLIISQIKPCILTCIECLENCENIYDYLNDLINEQSPLQSQFKNDFDIFLINQENLSNLLLPFIEEHCRQLGEFCKGNDYNENDYIMPLSISD